MICLLPLLFSCDEYKFEKAFNKLSEESYTMQGAMRIDMKMYYMGQEIEQTMVADMLIQSSPNEVYSETKMNGNVQRSYVKIDEELDEVVIYTNVGSSWEKETKTLEEYQQESESYFLDIEVKDVFTLEDEIWVGDTEIIASMLEEYIDEISAELVGANGVLSSFEVEKYNIEMRDKDISKLDIVMNMSMISSGITISMRMSMPMEVSEVGSTEVTVPDGLPK